MHRTVSTPAQRFKHEVTPMRTVTTIVEKPAPPVLLQLRYDIREAAEILRMSRAQLYIRINDGAIKAQKDGARTYITRAELERYVESCGER